MKTHHLIAFFGLLAALGGSALADTVFIQAGDQTGVGITRKRGFECFVVTSDHVLGNVQTASIVGYRGVRATVTKERTYSQDIAILRVSSTGTDLCGGEQWNLGEKASLKESMHWQIEGSNGDGSVKIMDATLSSIDDRFVDVRPSRPSDSIYQGMSGSLIKANGQPVAILIEVTKKGSRDEVGRGYRLDYLEQTLHSFFSAGDPFSGLYGDWQVVQPEVTKKVNSCKERIRSIISVSLSPTDIEEGKLSGNVEQIMSFEALSGCNVAATRGQSALAYTYRFEWVVTPSSPSEFHILSKYIDCSGPRYPKCFWNLGDISGTAKLDNGKLIFTNASGSVTFQKR